VSTPTSVYRYLDADGVLIYVGITNRGVQRQAEHVAHSKWWRFVHAQDVEHYDDRETAERRERYLIEKHQPPFNVTHNAEHKRRLAAYLKHAEPELKRCGHCEGCQLDAKPEDRTSDEDLGCRWWWELDPDEEAIRCEVCGSDRCVYADGYNDGSVARLHAGLQSGEEIAWGKANAYYAPVHQADYILRAVIDGPWAASGDGYWNFPATEQSLRDLEADIAEHGIDALVEKAKVPF
jgi:hypothetical protein